MRNYSSLLIMNNLIKPDCGAQALHQPLHYYIIVADIIR